MSSAYDWLVDLGLAVEPFISRQAIDEMSRKRFDVKYLIPDADVAMISPDLPKWVMATWAAAVFASQARTQLRWGASLAPWVEKYERHLHEVGGRWPHDVARRAWRGFLLVLEKDEASRRAIETVNTLDPMKAPDYVGELFAGYLDKIVNAPVVRAVQRVQELRARRISGRATGFAPDGIARPSDAEFDLEALPPKPRGA